MGQPAAKLDDQIRGVDVHLVVMPTGDPQPQSLPFSGPITAGVSSTVNIMGSPAATVGSTADNAAPHTPLPPGTGFVRPPTNRATIAAGSSTVNINGKPAARAGDPATTCNDPVDLSNGVVQAGGTVLIG